MSALRKFVNRALLGRLFPRFELTERVIEGWDNYRFGMSPEQVRGIPGRTWGSLQRVERAAFMDAHGLVELAGLECLVCFTFDSQDRLARVELIDPSVPTKNARRLFLRCLTLHERQYGVFSASNFHLDHTSERLPGGRSQYSIRRINKHDSILEAELERSDARIFLEGEVNVTTGKSLLSMAYQRPDWSDC
jgi:hypothetical protein